MQERHTRDKDFAYWVSRVFAVFIGLVLGAVVFICLVGSVALLFWTYGDHLVLKNAIAMGMILLSLWLMSVCVRLVVGRKAGSGLLGAPALHVLAWFFLLLPLGGLFTGYFKTHTLLALSQTVVYIAAFFALRRLARKRMTETALQRARATAKDRPDVGLQE